MFYFNRGTLKVDSNWKDESILILRNGNESISITRGEIPFGMTFDEFIEREITNISRQLTNYKELSRDIHKVSGCNAISTEFVWDSPNGKFHQLTLIIDMKDRSPLILTGSVLREMTNNQKKSFLSIMKSFKPHAY